MARVRFKARFYVLLFILIAIITGIVLYFTLGNKEAEMTSGVILLNEKVKSVIIRDEVSVPTERYDKIIFDVSEGASVENQQQIAQVFKWGYQEENMQSLLDVQRQIQEHQLTLFEGIVKPDLETVIADILKKQLEIRAAASGQSNKDLYELELELKELLNKRMELLRDVQADETLTTLYAQEEAQLGNIASWKRDIVNTAGEGVVSFYFDGYEQALSSEKLDMLTADLLSRVLKGGAVETVSSDAMESPLYRLINDEHFYIAFLTDNSVPFRLAQGEVYTIVFEGYANTPYTAVALNPILSGTQVVNILEFNQPMGDMIGIRVVEATLMKDVSGVRVPQSSIRTRDGMPGILRVAGSDAVWIEVEVLAVDADDAIVRAKNPDEILTPGLRYKK